MDTKLEKYGQSEKGNFFPIDTIGVPHPFVITHHHVAIASDHFGGSLGEAAIEAAYKKGHGCGWRDCRLSFAQHEKAILIGCKGELKDAAGKVNPELHTFLLKIKDQVETDGFAGFAFKKL